MFNSLKNFILEQSHEVADNRVITVIEILSPSNKSPGEDRKRYESKRNMIFRSDTNLVEIDLLRDGEPMPFTLLQSNGHLSHYRILVKRGDFGRRAYLYPFGVRDPIPNFPLPLQPGDAEPPIHLGKVLKEIYDEGGYDLYIDYSRPPEPPLSEADALWGQGRICARKRQICDKDIVTKNLLDFHSPPNFTFIWVFGVWKRNCIRS